MLQVVTTRLSWISCSHTLSGLPENDFVSFVQFIYFSLVTFFKFFMLFFLCFKFNTKQYTNTYTWIFNARIYTSFPANSPVSHRKVNLMLFFFIFLSFCLTLFHQYWKYNSHNKPVITCLKKLILFCDVFITSQSFILQ